MAKIIPWTEHEDAILERGLRQGLTADKLLEELAENGSDRTLSAVQNRVGRIRKPSNSSKKSRPVLWSEDETELMMKLLGQGKAVADVAEALNSEFGNNRDGKKVRYRLDWLKAQTRKRARVTKEESTALAPVVASTAPVQWPLPENPDRQVRLRYPSGSVVLSVQGTLPTRIQTILSDLVWSIE